MNTVARVLIVMIVMVFSVMPAIGYAAVDKAQSVIYFDANNNIIGQKILFCNQVREHSGNVDINNPNKVIVWWGCGNPMVACQMTIINGSPTETCFPSGYYYGREVMYFHSATGLTYQDYCNSPIGVSPFLGHPRCDAPAPAEIYQLQPFASGW